MHAIASQALAAVATSFTNYTAHSRESVTMASNMSVEQHQPASSTGRGLFVSTKDVSSSSSLMVSPVSTTSAKLTETPRKLKEQRKKSDSNNQSSEPEETETSDGDENQSDSQTRPVLNIKPRSSEAWASRSPCYSPRPKRALNPARRPVQSASSMRIMRLQEEEDTDLKKSGSFRLGNQTHLERIQEGDSSDESDAEPDDDVEYDGDGEEGEAALQLYKSLSGGDLLVRYDSSPSKTARRPSLRKHRRATHQAFDEEDDDVVRI